MLLEGRAGIVSGVGPGIGVSTALAFAREGADVGLGARTEATLRDTAAAVEGLGRKAVWHPTDITSEEQCAELTAKTHEAFGRIDVLVNNAFMHPPIVSIEESTPDDWRRAWKINVIGTLNMTKAVLPYMKEQGRGSIVFVSSMSARTSEERQGPYAATKTAMLSIVQTMAREVGPSGVRVNSVVPGYVWGPSLQWYFDFLAKERGVTRQDVYDEVASEIALRHIPDSDEVADTILFCASDLSRGMTGASVDVNGGHWMH